MKILIVEHEKKSIVLARLFILALLLFCSLSRSLAQESVQDSLIGKVIEQSTGETMEFVNVALFSSADTSFVKVAVTKANGTFMFTNIPQGKYHVQLSFIGFETFNGPEFTIDKTRTDLGTLPINISKQILGEITITEEKSVYESSIDRKVYNVDKDLMSTSSSASEIMSNVPSVSVDVDGNISLRGSGNVTILINGKPNAMMKVNSAAALQQIPASSIERIEVITNPSAKYKPDGSAGIINIVLKKEIRTGFNGTLIGNASINDRYNSSLLLNYKPGKLNLFGSYAFRQDYRERTGSDIRSIYDSTGALTSKYSNSRLGRSRPMSHTAELGIDYSFNEKNQFSISGNYFYDGFLRTETNTTTLLDPSDQITSDYDRSRLDNEYEWDHELSSSFEHKFKKEDHVLNFELELADHYEVENNEYTTTYRVPDIENSLDNTKIQQREKQATFITEYTLPINEESEFEAGYTWEYLKQDFNFFGEFFDTTQDKWTKDLVSSKQFIFTQNIHAAYMTYSREIEDFSFLAGLRGEQALLLSDLATFDSVVPNNYFKLYPTLHLSYQINDDQQLQLSYSKRVNRPEGDELNPFPEYRDPRNLSAGNPKLRPEQIHSLELGYELKKDQVSFLPTLYYKHEYDCFTEVSKYINDSTLLTTNENLSKNQSAGIEMVLTWSYKKILSMNLNANGFYNVIDASNLGYSESRAAFSGNIKIGLNINATKTTAMQLNTNLRSSELTPQGRELPGYSVNAGVRQDLFKKKASLVFTISDIFNSMKWASEIDTPTLKQTVINKRVSQIMYLGFVWRFGRSDKKTADELKFDEKM